MPHQEASVKSITLALLANLGIAVTKTIAAVLTGSGAMLAESIHSYADCGNQGLLFLGLRTAKRDPDSEHPLGYGKEIYFWSFIVALMLFSMGGLFSIYEGFHKLNSLEEVRNPIIAVIVLLLSMILEAFSLYGCLVQIKSIKDRETWWRWVKNSRQSELLVVLGEDLAALIGLTFALGAIVLSIATANPMYDAIGSVGIGTLLIIISVFLAVKIKSLLIGQSADTHARSEIREFLESRREICSVLNLITLQLGPHIMVAVKARMNPVESTDQLIENINRCESDLKKARTDVRWIFFEPDHTA